MFQYVKADRGMKGGEYPFIPPALRVAEGHGSL